MFSQIGLALPILIGAIVLLKSNLLYRSSDYLVHERFGYVAGLGVVAYQMVHVVRTTALDGEWRRAQPATLRAWVFRLPAKLTMHARKTYVHLLREEPFRIRFLRGLRQLAALAQPRRFVAAYG